MEVLVSNLGAFFLCGAWGGWSVGLKMGLGEDLTTKSFSIIPLNDHVRPF